MAAENKTRKQASEGSHVKVHYKGTLSDGSVFDASEGREPLAFTLGARQVVAGFEAAVKGMKVGEKKTVTLSPIEAYGDHDESMVKKVPRKTLLDAGIEPEVGIVLGLGDPEDEHVHIPARIVEVTSTTVTIDLNHSLAGKPLTFEIELVSVE